MLFHTTSKLDVFNCKLMPLHSLPTISPTPIKIPEMPINPLASWPKCNVLPIDAPYTPLKNVNSKPEIINYKFIKCKVHYKM